MTLLWYRGLNVLVISGTMPSNWSLEKGWVRCKSQDLKKQNKTVGPDILKITLYSVIKGPKLIGQMTQKVF